MAKLPLTIELLCKEARKFAALESNHREPQLYGITDGKAVGTYFEQKFRKHLQRLQYSRVIEKAAKVNGIHRLR